MTTDISQDKAGKAYWDFLWATETRRRLIDPQDMSVRNYGRRCFHKYFYSLLKSFPPGTKLLEVGCADSVWLPYFGKQYGFEVSGVDYSKQGCALAQARLEEVGINGEIICCDLFEPPPVLHGRFDIVFSLGLAEHFADTRTCLCALGRFLRPGGLMLTIIPNLVGTIGVLQKLLNRKIFDIHVPLSDKQLCNAHVEAGLVPRSCHYFLGTNFGVVNPGKDRHLVKQIIQRSLTGLSGMIWMFEDKFHVSLPATRLLSGFVSCVASKPTTASPKGGQAGSNP